MSNQIILLSCLILLLCCTETCKAQSKPLCNPSFCGSINISYPFRLRGDPPYCGHQDPSFVLECHDNQTILHLEPRTYHVQAITYSNFSIRVSDPGLDSKNYSSCPVYTSSVDDDPYSGYLYRDYGNSIYITFLNCLTPAANPSYIQNPFCGNTAAFSNTSRIYSYATIRTISLSDLEESCTFESVVTVSSPPPLDDHINYSYVQVHDMMAYGFQLTWYSVMCTECYEKGRSSCSLEDGKVVCSRYCDEHASLSERDFICKLEYYEVYLYFAVLAIGALLVLRFIVGISCMIGLVVSKQRSSMDEIEINEELLKQQGALINYSYGEIQKMANNFKAKLDEGPHGTVFRGKLRSGPSVAVKMLMNSSSKTSDKEFISDVSRISRISHPNIVKLIGICIKGAKRAMVYELVKHGSLGQHILLQGEMRSKPCLSYGDMFKISVGTARGIECLHSYQIVHLGIMPENILLDEGFNPKISDSVMSKLYLSDDHRNKSKGRMGITPPEVFYKNIGEVSCKADVYSFGMLVLEMVAKVGSVNPYADKPGKVYFPRWIYDQLSQGKELQLGDVGEEEKEMVKKMMVAALWCIQITSVDRPLINEVVSMLEGGIELLRIPPMPFQRAMDDDEVTEKST